MAHRSDVSQGLGQEVLRLYKQAVAERRWEVAEFLMCALEQLAKSDLESEAAVEQGYLYIGRGRQSFNA
ncbi:hypothetical protein [Variovorax durovernensis]